MAVNATQAPRSALSERALLPFVAGAATDALIGFDLILAAGWMAEWLAPGVIEIGGIAIEPLLRGLGLVLLLWGVATLAFAWLDLGTAPLWAVLALNEAWILGSIAVLVFAGDALSREGVTVLASVALAVAVLAWAQFRALRGLARA
ncbi:MAG: hypothetical protein KIT16_18845 [Rhodospirillaceae bacterium]|nr:hypothetical protein [Rhodospirillaceae bacterium]